MSFMRHLGASHLSVMPSNSSSAAGSAPVPQLPIPEIPASDLMLVRVLGRGGQKSVSLCRHRPSGALVVRCTIADNIALTQNPALIHRLKDEFHSEMATLCQLKHHRNIVKLLAVVSDAFEANALAAQRPGQGNIGQFPGFGGPRVNDINMLKQYEKADTKASIQSETLSFILEYCSNGSLRDVMNSEIVEFNMLLRVRIAKALARSVLFLHSLPMPIIHGDLKPGNCLLTRDFTVRLCDFGLSKTQAQTSGLMVTTRSVAGTSNYMAPEQFTQAQNKLSYKVDVWAFGCLLIELFHPQHKVPYGEFHTNAVPYQVAEGNMPPELDSVEPVELRALIRDKCLVKDADRRATMKEVLESLRTLFPNSTYPDEPNAEVDMISTAELRKRDEALPPAKFFQQFVTAAAAEQSAHQKKAAAVQAVAPPPPPPSVPSQVARPASARVAAAQQVYVLGKTSVALRVNECLESPGMVGVLDRPSISQPEPTTQEQRNLIDAPQYRAYRPQGPVQYQPPPALPPKQVLDRARCAAGIAVAAPAPTSVSTKSTSTAARAGARVSTRGSGL